MLTVSELAKSWRVSHQYVSRLVKRGLPLSSFEDAALWREAHASSKASTHPHQIARHLAEEKDGNSSKTRHRRKSHVIENLNAVGADSDDPLANALNSTIRAQDEAWRLLQEAMIEGKDSKIAVRLSIHNKAVQARIGAAIEHRKELERRRTLIPLNEAMDLARRGYDIILSRLAALPQNVAPRCNLAEPHRAMEVLEAECTAIVADAQRAYAS